MQQSSCEVITYLRFLLLKSRMICFRHETMRFDSTGYRAHGDNIMCEYKERKRESFLFCASKNSESFSCVCEARYFWQHMHSHQTFISILRRQNIVITIWNNPSFNMVHFRRGELRKKVTKNPIQHTNPYNVNTNHFWWPHFRTIKSHTDCLKEDFVIWWKAKWGQILLHIQLCARLIK